MLSKPGFGCSSDNEVDSMFRGRLGSWFSCVKEENGEYRLYRTYGSGISIGPQGKENRYTGNRVSDNKRFNGPSINLVKGKYYLLKMSNFRPVSVFKPKTKVLALKPKGGDDFEVNFTPAKIISGPTPCECSLRQDRNSYMVKFAGDKKPVKVYEELIVPTEDYWTCQQPVYEPKETDSSSSSDSSESSSTSDSSDSSSSSDSSDSKSKKHHHKKHGKSKKGHKKHHSHHHHGKVSKHSPKIVIMPIFIPYYY